MRKPDNNRADSRGRAKTAKAAESGKGARKPGSRPFGDKPKKRSETVFKGRNERSGEGEAKPRRSFRDKEERNPRRKEFVPGANTGRSSDDSSERKPRRTFSEKDERSPRKKEFTTAPRTRRSSDDAADKPRRSFRDKDPKFGDKRRGTAGGDKTEKRSFRPGGAGDRKSDAREGDKPFSKFRDKKDLKPGDKPGRPARGRDDEKRPGKGKSEDASVRRVKYDDFEDGKAFSGSSTGGASNRGSSKPKRTFKKQGASPTVQNSDGLIRLNKYLSNAGIASRREADTLIQSGVVKVNGVVIDQLGYKINPGDKVTYGDAPVRSEHKVYLLLNKPKDYITTVDDPQERKTVMELVAKACRERIYPVGRLDRNTTGLLLFTNDGELTTKLMHPKYSIKKVYHVSLNKGLKPEDFKAITEGIELEDGIVKADDLAFVGEGKKEIGIEIHSGRNRIVRRIFEHLGYDVIKLDRVAFAGLTKKDLPRGKYRFLTAKEIGFLQMIG